MKSFLASALPWLTLLALVSLFVTEIVLVRVMRDAVKEIRGMRSDLPKMLGAFGGLSFLLEGYRLYKGNTDAVKPEGKRSEGSR